MLLEQALERPVAGTSGTCGGSLEVWARQELPCAGTGGTGAEALLVEGWGRSGTALLRWRVWHMRGATWRA